MCFLCVKLQKKWLKTAISEINELQKVNSKLKVAIVFEKDVLPTNSVSISASFSLSQSNTDLFKFCKKFAVKSASHEFKSETEVQSSEVLDAINEFDVDVD